MTYQLKDKLFFGNQFADQIQLAPQWGGQHQKIEVSYNSGYLKLRFLFPFEVRNLFTNEILQHLVTTINKSPLNIFTLKITYQQERPVRIYFQLNKQHQMQINISYSVYILVPMKLYRFPRKIYDRMVCICQLYTIKHSQLAQANQFLYFLQNIQDQQDHFLFQIDLFLKQLTIDVNENLDTPRKQDIRYSFNV